MKIATMINSPGQAIADSAMLEELGYDALFTNESRHDPFVLSTLVAERTKRVEIMTYIAVAFARTPMLAATSGYDLNLVSKGRFTLGLGSQIKPHVERRFSMPWSHPAPRMKEFVRAMHAIWDTWEHGAPLKFEGEYYRHTLTSPTFVPQDHSYGRPGVGVAAVGPEMTKASAAVADNLLCHSFTTPRYLRGVTIPSIEKVLAEHGRTREALRLVGMPFIAFGETEEELAKAIKATKKHIAFYSSTPAYVGVLAPKGWTAHTPICCACQRPASGTGWER
jgi:probable F420-dependent oxidoreductase